ncbi:MAG: site-2 protease family protein [Candidatus Methanomethylophilaceae archaeon]|nr:site-2 protease family protein [Candidatus Methanomethylophilaceae archaeon]
METVYIVLLALLVVYIPIYIYVRKSEKAHEKGFVPYGPTIMIRTKWGLKLMDRMAKYKRFWNVMGYVSLGVSLVLAIIIVTILAIDLSVLPQMFGRSGIGIEYALAIPGLNPMLPIVYGIIGLVVAMVIHEMAHGIQSRANDIGVDSSGILYGVVPLGAFVEPNEEQTAKASRKARMHVYAAGITTNTFMAIITFAIMFFAMTNCLVSDYSDNAAVYAVVSDTEAYDLEIEASSIILSVDGNNVDADGLVDYIKTHHTADLRHDVTFLYKGTEYSHNMALGACIVGITSDSPASNSGMKKGGFIMSIDGIDVSTPEDFSDIMTNTHPGQTITLTYMNYDSASKSFLTPVTEDIVLDTRGDKGFLGVSTSISGISVTTPRIMVDTGINPLYGKEGLQDSAMGLLSYISMPFKGFSPIPESVTWWYDNGDAFWIFIWIVYWIFWLDIVLAISNALPALPFDGGLLLVGLLDWLYEKGGVKEEKARDEYVGATANVISYAMLGILVLVLVAIII